MLFCSWLVEGEEEQDVDKFFNLVFLILAVMWLPLPSSIWEDVW